MSDEKLTWAQQRTLDAIVTLIGRHGYAPTYDQIAIESGIASRSTVYVHMEHLRRKGYLEGRGRALRLRRSATAPEPRPEDAEQDEAC